MFALTLSMARVTHIVKRQCYFPLYSQHLVTERALFSYKTLTKPNVPILVHLF